MKLPDEIKFRAPGGTKDRLLAVAKAKSKTGHRSVTISDEAREAVMRHLNNEAKKAKA